MVQSLERNCDRHFAHEAISWQQFKSIQIGFENVPNLRLIYCEGILELMGIGKAHEMYTSLLGSLLTAYFEICGIEFFLAVPTVRLFLMSQNFKPIFPIVWVRIKIFPISVLKL